MVDSVDLKHLMQEFIMIYKELKVAGNSLSNIKTKFTGIPQLQAVEHQEVQMDLLGKLSFTKEVIILKFNGKTLTEAMVQMMNG